MGSHSRVHYMDNLRAYAMLLGVFFHAALAYSPMLNQIWLAADSQHSVLMDIFAYFSHTFRMPLFFLIAGFFAALLIEKRGENGMLKHRLLRITLPFVIFLPLVIISFALLVGWALENVEHKSPMLNLFAMMSQLPEPPQPPLTTTHLWFLYQLTFFYLVTYVLAKWVKLDWTRHLIHSPKLLIFAGPLLLVPALMTQHAPLAAPEQFVPQLWSFGFFGLFFLFGWALYKQESLLNTLAPYATWLFLVSCIAYAWFYSMLPKGISMQEIMTLVATPPELTLQQFILASLQAYMGFYMSIVALVYGRQFLNKPNVVSRVISNSSYWIYIIHLPVLWMIQFTLLDTELPLMVEFLISSLGTILIGLISYLLIVKSTPVGWLLNGRKRKKKAIQAGEDNERQS